MNKKIAKKIWTCNFKNKDGFSIIVLKKAPRQAKDKSDIVALATVKKNAKGKLLESSISYYTPDEAIAVGLGLITGADYVLRSFYKDIRKKIAEKTDLVKLEDQ